MKKTNIKTTESQEVIKLIKILLGIIILFCGIFLFTGTFITKTFFQKDKQSDVVKGEINYDKLIMGEVFSKSDEKYYVLMFSESDDQVETYKSLMENYKANPEYQKIYYVDLDDGFNKKYVSEEVSNPEATDLSNLKVNGVTLIHLTNGQIDKYIEKISNIEKELNGV